MPQAKGRIKKWFDFCINFIEMIFPPEIGRGFHDKNTGFLGARARKAFTKRVCSSMRVLEQKARGWK